MTDQPVYPRVDEIAPYLPPEVVHAVGLAVARWENAQLRQRLAELEQVTEPEVTDAVR